MDENLTPISIVRSLRERDLFYFTPHLLGALFGLERARVYRLVAQLKRDQLIAEVEKGKYLLLGLEPERVLANPLFIASQLITPAYVSYWSALHFYGFTEQAPLTIFVATTKKKRPVEFQGMHFRFVTIQPHKFFGYVRESVGEMPVLIADPAKAIIDSFDQPRYAGGVPEIAKSLRNALPEVEIATLELYATAILKTSNCPLRKRVFALVGLGVAAKGDRGCRSGAAPRGRSTARRRSARCPVAGGAAGQVHARLAAQVEQVLQGHDGVLATLRKAASISDQARRGRRCADSGGQSRARGRWPWCSYQPQVVSLSCVPV
jgi:predicted transcriptional regulator of viral defense system